MQSIPQNHFYAYQPGQNQQEQPLVIERKRHFLMQPLEKLQSWQEQIVKFVFSLIYLILKLPFNIGIRILDLVERGVRYLIWINIKSAVSWVNFVYRCLAFFRITVALNIIDSIAKEYFRKYSSIDFQKAEQPSRFSLIMRKKNYDLINIDKFEKRIKTPTFFIQRDIPKVQEQQQFDQPQQEQVRQNVQQPYLIREQRQRQGLNEDRNVSPKLVDLSRSHERMKKPEFSQDISSRNPQMTVQIPSRTQNQGSQTRIFPDRDISPERYMKRIPRIGEDTFSEEQTNIQLKPTLEGFEPKGQELECSTFNPYPTLREDQISKKTKQELEGELQNLRSKMQDLIDDNKSYIQELEQWLKEKSLTVTQTRKQNLELLEEMKKLQKENIKKTKNLTEIEQKIKSLEAQLQLQRSERDSVTSQIIELNDEIREKSIELLELKDKINKNFKKIQEKEAAQRTQRSMRSTSKSEDESTLQNSMAREDFQEEQLMEKLREQEQKTYELADKVQKLVENETRRLEQTKIQMLPQQQNPNLPSKLLKSSQTIQGRRKKSEPTVLKSDGKSRITMRFE